MSRGEEETMNREHYRLVHNAMAEVAMEAEAQLARAGQALDEARISSTAYFIARAAADAVKEDSEMVRLIWIAEHTLSDAEVWSSWVDAEDARHARDVYAVTALREMLRWVNA